MVYAMGSKPSGNNKGIRKVREDISDLTEAGFVLDRQPGTSHRVFKKGGVVITIPGHLGDDFETLLRKTNKGSHQEVKMKVSSRLYSKVVDWDDESECFVGRALSNPELLCISTGDTESEAMDKLVELLDFHLQAMADNGLKLPKPIHPAFA
jgi:predicted RNase H-like HicB family nuclease/predicted RNA binding protein YcfA (HicA-like mRNA interferase family)